jgi:hypothetical protein
MAIRSLVLTLALAFGVLVAPPTATADTATGTGTATRTATDTGITVSLDRLWRVGGGAAVEAAYTVSCPEAREAGSLYALWAQRAPDAPTDYIEFWCYPGEPQRVILLMRSWNAPPGTEIRLTSTVTNWLFAGWEDGIPGAYQVETTATKRVKRGAFEPPSWAEIDADLRLVRTRLTRGGGVRVVQRLRCDRFSGGPMDTDVIQRTDEGTVWARGWPGDSWVECEPGEKQTLKYVVQPGTGQTFTRGRTLLLSEWRTCEEYCTRGVSGDEVRLRPRR